MIVVLVYVHVNEDAIDAFKDAALRECIALARQTGDRYLVCQALHGMGDMLMFEHDDRAAEPWYLESWRLARETDGKWSIYGALNHLGFGYLRLSRIDRAEARHLGRPRRQLLVAIAEPPAADEPPAAVSGLV